MGLKSVFIKGVETAFKVFGEAVHQAEYKITEDDGWGDSDTVIVNVRVVLDKFTQEDVESSSFSDLIQHTDTKGMIPGIDLTEPLSTSNILKVGEREFTIVAFETDPMQALYTLLLRAI